jgi:hypothetical protein
MTLDLEARRALCEAKVTLDGKPAKIIGAAEQYATVHQTPDGFGWHWSWTAVAHIVANRGGAFRS